MPEKTVFIRVLCTCRYNMRQGRHVMRLRGLLLALALQACVVRDTTPVNPGYGYGYGYGYGPQVQGSVAVSTPSPYSVSSLPPAALYQAMTPPPGYGFVWIDGYCHRNGLHGVWRTG